jgi:two-component system NtrC family response regulator
MTKRSKILVVDDDPSIVTQMETFLTGHDFDVITARNLQQAEKKLTNQIDAILLDHSLPDGSGADWVPKAKEICPQVSIVMITGESDVSLIVRAMVSGADNFLVKPVKLHELLVFLEKSIEVRALRQQSARSDRIAITPPFLAGSSKASERMLKLAEIAASSDSVVLLLGESGSGKGMLAQWIHDHSSRSEEAMVQINCSGLSSELLQSEFFGHVKGAFTSAHKDKSGLLELADRGTLFLDECGDLPQDIQPKFLKVLEEKCFKPVGGTRDIWTDFRLICATNRNLEDMILEKTFREDLYFRINVFPIHVPSLRERKTDIPLYIDFFLTTVGRHAKGISPGAVNMLKNYGWPGNMRELRNVIERGAMLAQGRVIDEEHLVGLRDQSSPFSRRNKTLVSLAEHEKTYLQWVLKQVNGDKKQAAEILEISRSTLYRKLDALGF